MKTKLTKLVVLSAVALFATSCAKLPNVSLPEVSLPECGEWTWPKHLTDAGKAAAENDTKKNDK